MKQSSANDINAKCARSCSGGPSGEVPGCMAGSTACRSSAAKLLRIGFEPTPRGSGLPATVARPTTGGDGPWCCERGRAQGRSVCDECAEVSRAYSAAMAPVRDELANGQTTSPRCADCMVGQGRECRCERPGSLDGLRWLIVIVVLMWLAVGGLVRSCS